MGFSVSGSFAVIAIGTFIAVGMFYGAASNGAERVTDSQADAFDNRLEQQNTAINITVAKEASGTLPIFDEDTLVIEVNNTGSTALHINSTDYVVDNEFITHHEIETTQNADEFVVGESSTDLWLPGETLRVEFPIADLTGDITCDSRVKVVSDPGVSDSKGVTNC